MKKVKRSLLAIIFLAMLYSCGNKKEITYEIKDAVFSIEQPIFSGSNTFQAELPLTLKEILNKQNLKVEDIKNVSIEAIEISTLSPSNFNNYENILVQFFGEKADMIEIGNLSPINKDVNMIEPKIALDQDVKAFLLSEKIGIVLDANFLQDDTINYELKSTLKFKITF